MTYKSSGVASRSVRVVGTVFGSYFESTIEFGGEFVRGRLQFACHVYKSNSEMAGK